MHPNLRMRVWSLWDYWPWHIQLWYGLLRMVSSQLTYIGPNVCSRVSSQCDPPMLIRWCDFPMISDFNFSIAHSIPMHPWFHFGTIIYNTHPVSISTSEWPAIPPIIPAIWPAVWPRSSRTSTTPFLQASARLPTLGSLTDHVSCGQYQPRIGIHSDPVIDGFINQRLVNADDYPIKHWRTKQFDDSQLFKLGYTKYFFPSGKTELYPFPVSNE